ncbi:MAG TPA: MopE-related protein, partial [Myxococcota bacterium]|nr:MopE-related protein [Myxococcota bacterium]
GQARAEAPLDCDDGAAATYPGAAEQPADGVDQDCDGREICHVDADGDGYGVAATQLSAAIGCDAPGDATSDGGDCDDANATIHPDAEEAPGDRVDQDCDGEELCYTDADDDGWRTDAVVASPDRTCADHALAQAPAGDCDDARDDVHPTAQEAVADGLDADCDGQELCPVDGDGDGQPSDAAPIAGDLACAGPGLTSLQLPLDCDDGDAAIAWGAPETLGDGVDSDCDGLELCHVDADQDGYPGPDTTTTAALGCDAPGVTGGGLPDCDDADPAIHPGAVDIPGNGVAEDCSDVTACYADADLDGYGTDEIVPSADADCADPGEAAAGGPQDCDDADPLVHPGVLVDPVGDGVDSDCDGLERCWQDLDDDGWAVQAAIVSGDLRCDGPGEATDLDPTGDCDDERPDIHPTADEAPADGVDQDCDGQELCYADADADGQTSGDLVAAASLQCFGPGLTGQATPTDCDDADPESYVGATERPADGVDQSCDGREACYVDADGDGHGRPTLAPG